MNCITEAPQQHYEIGNKTQICEVIYPSSYDLYVNARVSFRTQSFFLLVWTFLSLPKLMQKMAFLFHGMIEIAHLHQNMDEPPSLWEAFPDTSQPGGFRQTI